MAFARLLSVKFLNLSGDLAYCLRFSPRHSRKHDGAVKEIMGLSSHVLRCLETFGLCLCLVNVPGNRCAGKPRDGKGCQVPSGVVESGYLCTQLCCGVMALVVKWRL